MMGITSFSAFFVPLHFLALLVWWVFMAFTGHPELRETVAKLKLPGPMRSHICMFATLHQPLISFLQTGTLLQLSPVDL